MDRTCRMVCRGMCVRAVLLLLFLVAVPGQAQQRTGLPAATLQEIEKAITAQMARDNIPGLSVAVVVDRELRWSNGYGLADMENFVPAKAATVYRLGSISKPITAVAVMQLVERGKIDLDAPVQQYVPSFPRKSWPITTRQLLGHLAGIRHYRGREIDSTRHYTSLTEGLSIFKDDPLLHEPGTKYQYSTYGYDLLGCVVEGAAAMPFSDYLRQHLFQPAGMDRMRVDDVYAIIPNRAQGYTKAPNGELRNSALADTSYKVPGGGLCSTVEDLALFAIAVQKGRLVKPETLQQMFTRQKLRDGTETAYGLGWGIAARQGHAVISHGGAQQRVSTYLMLVPDAGFAVAVMANLEGAGSSALARRIADIVLERKP